MLSTDVNFSSLQGKELSGEAVLVSAVFFYIWVGYPGGNIRVVVEEENASWVQLFKEGLSGSLRSKFGSMFWSEAIVTSGPGLWFL